MKKIWFNHWFSAAYYIIELIKQENAEFHFTGSNSNSDATYRLVCDEWYTEPVIENEDEYAGWCLEFCINHKIDIFVPKRGMAAISRNKKHFEAAGVKVLADDYEKIFPLESKSQTYRLLSKHGIGYIPDYHVVTTAKDFRNAYASLRQKYERICFKYDMDEGAASFRCIEENKAHGINAVFRKRNTAEEIAEAIEEEGTVRPLIVMPFLPDDEVSVDCLATSSGPVMIPRYKNYTRIEHIHFDDSILDTCRRFLEITRLECPCNIQFRYLNGIPYFLEVNTRMSGGIHMTCLASGISIPHIAVNKLFGIEIPWSENRTDKTVTHVEKPLVLK